MTAKSAKQQTPASPQLQPGDKAPAFSAPTDGGGQLALKDLKGKPFVLYFYPKDDTTGCTKEACDFRDNLQQFKKLGVAVIGVSKDSPARHDKFKAKYDLPFPLISDEDGAICAQWGVWVEKSMYGRKYFGIERSTFLIDEKGIIQAVWRKVSVTDHVKEVISEVKKITK